MSRYRMSGNFGRVSTRVAHRVTSRCSGDGSSNTVASNADSGIPGGLNTRASDLDGRSRVADGARHSGYDESRRDN